MNTTDWFPSSVRPIRRGFYEVRFGHTADICPFRKFWTGEEWRMSDMESKTVFGLWANCQWRGLQEPSK